VAGVIFLNYWAVHPDLFCDYNSPLDEAATVIAEQRDALAAMQRVPEAILEGHPAHRNSSTDVRYVKVSAIRLHARVADIYLDTNDQLYAGEFAFAQIWRDVYGRHHAESNPCVLLNAHNLTGFVTRQPCCYNPL
jgi:hypothetical protein